MKKFLSKIVLVLLAAAVSLSAAACGGEWSKSDVSLKEWGAVKSNNGFIAETANYVYYINGVGSSVDDNSFGSPKKGALVAAKKSDIIAGNENVEKCVVVPKLFVAEDYGMGLFIKGDYVYYATPSTDKTSSGGVASDEIQFMKTKLDGTSSESLLKAGAISDKYRILSVGDVVYIVVYDSENAEIICYNTAAKKSVSVIKTDDTADESLAAYLFADSAYSADGAVVFTTTVYKTEYDKAAAEKDSSYSRETESYNNVYVYKAGDNSAKLVIDGKTANASYSLTKINGEYLFYTKTVNSGSLVDASSSYAVKVSDLYDGEIGETIYNTDYISDSNVIVSPDEIYTFNSDKNFVKKVSLKDASKKGEKNVAAIGTSATLKFVDGGYVYYTNDSSELLRIKLNDENADYEKITDGAINTSWYAPVILELDDGEKYVFYSDNSAEGCGYIKAVSLAQSNRVSYDADGNKTVDPEEIDHYAFENGVSLGIFTEEDLTTVASEKILSITSSLSDGKLVFDTDDDGNVVLDDSGLPVIAKINSAKAAYEKLSSDAKKEIENNYATLKTYEKAYELSRTLYKLNDFDKKDKAGKDALKKDYETAKSALTDLDNDKNYSASEIKALCATNMMWFYQTADNYFNK